MAVEDVTHLLDKETGSAFDHESILFTAFDDGAVFNYDEAQVRDMKAMLEVDGKAQTLQKVLALPIRQAGFNIRQGMASKKVTDFVEQALTQPANNGGMTTPMNTVIAQMCNAIVYKKAYFEKVFTIRDGKVVYDKLAMRPANTCAISRDPKTAAFRGFRQMPIRMEDTEEIVIPANRAFVYIHGTDVDPLEGKSDLDVALWCYRTKQKIRFLWYSFLEGQSLPKTIVKARDPHTAEAAARKVVGLRQGGVVGLTNDVDVDAFESSGKGADQFKAALQWLDAEASGSVLAGFTDLGAAAASGIGSFALSKDQTDFFLMMEQAKSLEMQDCINQYALPDLVAHNFGPNEPAPRFEFGPIAQDDAEPAISLLQALGVTESPVLPREFYDELIERVAAHLGMSTQKVREGLEKHKERAQAVAATSGNPAAERVAPLAGATTGAFHMVQSEQARQAS